MALSVKLRRYWILIGPFALRNREEMEKRFVFEISNEEDNLCCSYLVNLWQFDTSKHIQRRMKTFLQLFPQSGVRG